MKAFQAQASGLVVESQYRIRHSQTKTTRDRRERMLPLPNGAAAQTTAATGETSVVARAWTEAADGEARNALQVILSGGDLLLDNFFGRLSPAQKRTLERVLASARHLNSIIITLSHSDAATPLTSLNRQPTRTVVEPHGQARGTLHYAHGAKS